MELTPLDIHHKEFHRSIRGYSEEEVDVFLDQVADAFERLFNQNRELKEQVEKMKEKVDKYEGLEQTLQKALFTAQQAADEVQSSAKKESELIVRDAELKAKEIIQNIDERKMEVKNQLNVLKEAEKSFRGEFKELLQNYLDNIKKVEAGEIPEMAETVSEETKETEEAEVEAVEQSIEVTAETEREISSEESMEQEGEVTSEEIYQQETDFSEEEPTVFIPPPSEAGVAGEHAGPEKEDTGWGTAPSEPAAEVKREEASGNPAAQEGESSNEEQAASITEPVNEEQTGTSEEKNEKKVQEFENFFDNSSFFDEDEDKESNANDGGTKGRSDERPADNGGSNVIDSKPEGTLEPDIFSTDGPVRERAHRIEYGYPEPQPEKAESETVSDFFDENIGSEENDQNNPGM